jgi:alanine racemase
MLFRKRKPESAEAPALTPGPEFMPVTAPLHLDPTVTTGGPPAEEAGAILSIDCGGIVQNWRALASHVAPAECAAVLKADAYGCGLDQVASALVAAGCKSFFVAHFSEARRLRAIAPSAAIYVLNGIVAQGIEAFARLNIRPVINSIAELAEWDAFRKVHHWQGGAALHFDTGMNRLGIPTGEASALAGRLKLPDHGISLVMSHFACADELNHPLNTRQVHAFRDIRMMFRGVPASLANSSGIFLGPSSHFDMVRPGLALYGGNPTPTAANPMRQIIELKARIVQFRDVPKGATVGYGATWTARRDSRIAIVSIGYADGFPRPAGASDKTEGGLVVVARKRCPVVGRVSMDLMAVDITDVTERPVRRGDFAWIIGEDIDVDELANWGRTISYDVLTRLGHRYHRVWKS